MILAIDVGNTNIIIGVIDAKKTYFVERITTTIGKPNLEYAVALKSILEIYHIAPDQLDGAIVSSVVPPLNRTILAAIRKITGLNAMLVGSGMKTGLNILMDNPKSVGSDMIVNAVGALAEHEPPIIIIEMGTATTMSVIDKNGRYVGGAILPGLRVSLDSMSASTAQLPRISLDTPRRVIGKNTIDCMRSGVIFGNAAMIDGMLDRIEEELGEKTSIIATGGISKIVLPLCSHTITYDGALLMKGLLHLYEKNRRTEKSKRLSLGRCIYMIHSDGRQPFYHSLLC